MTLTLLLLALRYLVRRGRVRVRDRDPAAGAADPGAGAAGVGTEPLNTSSGYAWFTSAFESRWHACPGNTKAGNSGLRALCGHLSRRGPYRARASNSPPVEEGRSVCDACLHAIGYLPPRLPRLSRLPPVWITHGDTEPGWPTTDPDEPNTPAEKTPGNPCPAGTGHHGLPAVA
ncbi:hypothetical protein SAMN04487904_10411 [Actinopolyspora lacussalsi subsp. righensis]|uniref:Uncharacterized protein n=1 Tax=Actinopolyspora righensis TaxID=995060 RepID=A0A1I6Z751_9ACTN|nr:hypothetical protein [Actinopolyspora righensis]SFT58231.1 hypothetical protein SAMN04487904_10411 [Actinopolyspora righensis]